MAPKSDSTDAIVLNFVNEQNKPLSAQNVADALQILNLEKTAVQKALDSLTEGGRISCKEYGKQKLYMARQDQFDTPNTEERTQMKEENHRLQGQLKERKTEVSEVESEIKALQSNLTLEKIDEREPNLRTEVKVMEDKLASMRGGVTLVSPEDRKAVKEIYTDKIRMFKDLSDAITGNSPKDLKQFKVELGIDSLRGCLMRLPVESLMRLRVSNVFWRNTDDPCFIGSQDRLMGQKEPTHLFGVSIWSSGFYVLEEQGVRLTPVRTSPAGSPPPMFLETCCITKGIFLFLCNISIAPQEKKNIVSL